MDFDFLLDFLLQLFDVLVGENPAYPVSQPENDCAPSPKGYDDHRRYRCSVAPIHDST